MTRIKTTLEVDGFTNAYVYADVKDLGPDGTDTYTWSWGIDLSGGMGYYEVDSGEIQHRETDGSLALLAKIIERIRGRKADK